MSYNGFLHNISLGKLEYTSLDKNSLNELKEFLRFKKNKSLKNNNSFKKETNLTGEFKCVNWFKYKYNNYLSFLILKARNTETHETVYFHFKLFYFMFYTQEDIKSNRYIKKLFDFSKEKSSIYDIYSYILKDYLLIGVEHYKKFNTILNYFSEIDSVYENINNVKRGDIYLLATNFLQNKNNSKCENNFMDIRVFYLLNNIEPSCTFSLTNFKINKGDKENTYFIKTSNIIPFFKDKIEIIKKEIPRYYISFDIESDVNPSRSIDSQENIITHCALEYFVSTYYNKNYETKIKPFNFCLINKDFHYLSILYRKKDKLIADYPKYQNKDKLYFDIINKEIPNKLANIINNEIDNIQKNYYFLKNTDLNKDNDEFKKILSNTKYIFCNEKTLIKFILRFFYLYEVDYILSYNGHNYDFPQLGKRLSYLENLTVSKTIKLRSLYNFEDVYYSTSNNNATNFSISNMICNTPYFSVDIFNYVKKFYQNENSYSLKEISKGLFNLNAICICRSKNTRYYEYEIILLYNENPINNIDFIKVLLSSNYCFINNISYVITDKSEIINHNQNMYDVDINRLVTDYEEIKGVKILKGFTIKTINEIDNNLNNDTNFVFENYKNFIVKVNLSKDDVEISSSEIASKISNLHIANYCIHDTLLCRHLFDKYLIKENIDIYSNLNFLPQSLSLCYRNNTNINGYILKTCFKEKIFLIKSKKFCINSFTGGKVFEPKENFIKEPVMVFDFESLYPSIIIKYNISPECLVVAIKTESLMDFNLLKNAIQQKFSEEFYTIVYNIDDKDELNVKYNIVVYTKIFKDGSRRNGFLNIMLQDLKKIRKQYKASCKQFKNENNMYMSKHCDITQTNVKLLMNCVYGLMGSEFSIFSCKFSSQSITSLGAKNIIFLEQYLTDTKISNNTFSIHNKNYVNDDIFTEDNKLQVYNPATQRNIKLYNPINIDYPFDHELSLKIIYGDTDSIMVILKNINTHPYILENKDEYESRVIKLVSIIGNKINTIINNNILENDGLNLEFENIILEMIIQSKKKYLGKTIEPLNLESYSDLQINSTNNFTFKEFNKGTSIKRRDICKYQKKLMVRFQQLLKRIIINNRYTNDNISIYKMYDSIWSFIEHEIKNILIDFLDNKLLISEFLISSSFTDNYKCEDNQTAILIKNYNNTSKDQIKKGDRFNYIFLVDQDKNINDELLKIEKDKLTLPKICKIMNWTNIESKINNYKFIYDENLNLQNLKKRICFEIYINKLISDIITLFPETNIIKKKIKEFYNGFLYEIKNT